MRREDRKRKIGKCEKLEEKVNKLTYERNRQNFHFHSSRNRFRHLLLLSDENIFVFHFSPWPRIFISDICFTRISRSISLLLLMARFKTFYWFMFDCFQFFDVHGWQVRKSFEAFFIAEYESKWSMLLNDWKHSKNDSKIPRVLTIEKMLRKAQNPLTWQRSTLSSYIWRRRNSKDWKTYFKFVVWIISNEELWELWNWKIANKFAARSDYRARTCFNLLR